MITVCLVTVCLTPFQMQPPRSLRNFTAPGAYNPLASDFDKLRMKILKQKKMASRSSWAQNVAFTSTEVSFILIL